MRLSQAEALRPFSPWACRHLGEVLVHLGGGFVALEILALDQALDALLQVDGLGGELELWEGRQGWRGEPMFLG